jgi:hypothetical protein
MNFDVTQVYKTFDVTTAGLGANTTLATICVPAGTYKVEVEAFVPCDSVNQFPSEGFDLQPSGDVVWSPFAASTGGPTGNFFLVKNTVNGPSESSGGSGWVPSFVKLPIAIMTLASAGDITLHFTDYIYGGAVEVKGIIIVSPISAD